MDDLDVLDDGIWTFESKVVIPQYMCHLYQLFKKILPNLEKKICSGPDIDTIINSGQDTKTCL